jgi:hypothetical protein
LNALASRRIGQPDRRLCHARIPGGCVGRDYVSLDVLRQPANTLAVALSHDNTAHENLNGADALKRDLALAGGLVETKLVSLRDMLASEIL